MKQHFQFSMTRASVMQSKNQLYVMQSKNEFVINVDVSVKNQMKFGIFVKKGYMQNPSTKLVNIKKRLFAKLVLACEDEILKTTETLIFNRKVKYGKNSCLVHTTGSFELCAYHCQC